MADVYRNMIVTAYYQDVANNICETLSPNHGQNMFTTGLNAMGTGTPTHYISSGFISEEFAALMPLMTVNQETNEVTVIQEGNADAIIALMQAAGASNIPSKTVINNMFSKADVTIEPAMQTLNRLALKLIYGG